MRHWIPILCGWALLLGGTGTMAGTLTGTVRAEGKAGTEAPAGGGGGYESRKFKFADRINYAKMEKILKLAYLSAWTFASEAKPPIFNLRTH